MSARILIIEDEKKFARFVEMELNYEGYEVVKALDGRIGLELAESEEFDLILLDIMLPGLNGIELLRRIRRNSSVHIIMLTARDSMAWLAVQDNGIGIPPEAVSRIFDRFYRADESRARATGGTGLGLSIAKWIIERHGGCVEVLSRQDIGTRVSIGIPASVISPTLKASTERHPNLE